MRELRDEIIQMLEKEKRLPTPISETSHLYTDLGLDSLSYVIFLLKIEEAYTITFEISEMENCLRVDKLIGCMIKKLRVVNII